jgi:hypothetical protein
MPLWLLSISLKGASVLSSWQTNSNWTWTRSHSHPAFESCDACLDWIDGQLELEGRTITWLKKDEGLAFSWQYSYRDWVGPRNQTVYLKNQSNPLNESELLAVWFQTTQKYREIRTDVATGRAGIWNCLLDYLDSALGKLRRVANGTVLYSGIRGSESLAWGLTSESGDALIKPGDVIVATSQVSYTSDDDIARHYATNDDPGLRAVMLVATGPLSAVEISPFSLAPFDFEHVSPPGTRLLVRAVEDDVLLSVYRESVNVSFVNVTELEPVPTIWEDDSQIPPSSESVETQTLSLPSSESVGTQTRSLPSTGELGSKSWWEEGSRAKLWFGIAVGVTVIVIVLGAWMCCLTRCCRQPCSRPGDQILPSDDPLLTLSQSCAST